MGTWVTIRKSSFKVCVPIVTWLVLYSLDNWTPLEMRVFETAIECFGKKFHHVAQMVTLPCMTVGDPGFPHVLTWRIVDPDQVVS